MGDASCELGRDLSASSLLGNEEVMGLCTQEPGRSRGGVGALRTLEGWKGDIHRGGQVTEALGTTGITMATAHSWEGTGGALSPWTQQCQGLAVLGTLLPILQHNQFLVDVL